MIILINIVGVYCGIGVEECGEGEVIVKNLFEMFDLKVLIIVVIIGEGGSGGVFVLGLVDEVWMLEEMIYVVFFLEGFVLILWKDGSCVVEVVELMKIIVLELCELGIVDWVIFEMFNGE